MQPDFSAFVDELTKIASVRGWLAENVARRLGRGAKRQLHGFVGGSGLKPTDRSLLQEVVATATSPRKTLGGNLGGMGLGEKALLGGFTGMELSAAAKNKGDRAGGLGGAAGNALGWMAFRKTPLLANLVGMQAVAAGGRALGRRAGRAVEG